MSRTAPSRTPPLRTPAWLLRGIQSLPGTLRLSGGRLSFTALPYGSLRSRALRALEQEVGRSGLMEVLKRGETAVVFDVPLSDVEEVRFPWYYFSGGIRLTIHGTRFRFGFDQPANTKGAGEGGDLFGSISRARRRGKAWHAAFAELWSAPPPSREERSC